MQFLSIASTLLSDDYICRLSLYYHTRHSRLCLFWYYAGCMSHCESSKSDLARHVSFCSPVLRAFDRCVEGHWLNSRRGPKGYSLNSILVTNWMQFTVKPRLSGPQLSGLFSGVSIYLSAFRSMVSTTSSGKSVTNLLKQASFTARSPVKPDWGQYHKRCCKAWNHFSRLKIQFPSTIPALIAHLKLDGVFSFELSQENIHSSWLSRLFSVDPTSLDNKDSTAFTFTRSWFCFVFPVSCVTSL